MAGAMDTTAELDPSRVLLLELEEGASCELHRCGLGRGVLMWRLRELKGGGYES